VNGFVDETTIVVTSGNGGDGAVSFRREKYVPRGGPDGGDGGKGGDVVFQVQANLKTLSHLKLKRIFRAGNGWRGARQRMHGRDGHDVTIEVPPGTVILDPDTGAPIADLTAEGQVFTCLRGGRGGKGNWHYATSINQAPRYAQKGVPGETRELRAELHLIADIGFVGLPNAGKSTLLSVLTNARPLIADYPFTTRTPMLGLLRLPQRDVVLADIPGIIEGASRGRGLGLKFLRHIERCAALLYLVDLAGRDCAGAVKVLEAELAAHAAPLAGRPRILVGTKNDLPGSEAGLAELRDAFPRERIVSVSSVSRQGLSGLTAAILDLVSARRETDAEAGRTPSTELEVAGDKSEDVVAGNDRSENVARSDRA
jgi:GTP-binding protein